MMTSFNMPPGCNVSDIPGNRPEDREAEAFYDAFYERLPSTLTDTQYLIAEHLANWAWQQVGEAYHKGYQAGMADEAMANDQITTPVLQKARAAIVWFSAKEADRRNSLPLPATDIIVQIDKTLLAKTNKQTKLNASR